MNYKAIREYMEQANIYLFLSNHEEGWGVVLNEAMNSGCAVVANRSAGSVPYLLKNKYNGVTFVNGHLHALKRKVYRLCRDRNMRELLGWNAYKTIEDSWNPQQAVNNFVELCEALMENKSYNRKIGPASKA